MLPAANLSPPKLSLLLKFYVLFLSFYFLFLYYYFFNIFVKIKIAVLDNITPAPAGILNTNEIINPAMKAINDITPEIITRALKPDAKFLAVTAGRIITPEIKRVPVILIPDTTTRAVKIEIIN